MEVHLTPESETQLAKLATEQGQNADTLAEQVIMDYLKREARFVEAVEAGEAALDRGDFLTHEEAGNRLRRLLKP